MNKRFAAACTAVIGGIGGYLFLEYGVLMRVAAGSAILYIIRCAYESANRQIPFLLRAAAAGMIGAGSEKIMQFLLLAWTGNAQLLADIHYTYWMFASCLAALLHEICRPRAEKNADI